MQQRCGWESRPSCSHGPLRKLTAASRPAWRVASRIDNGRFIHLRKNDDGKLEYANTADATKRDTLGYGKDGRILVEPTAWRKVVCAGYDPEKTAKQLKAEGLLMADEAGGKLQRQMKVLRGGDVVTGRFYVLDPTILEDAADIGSKESAR